MSDFQLEAFARTEFGKGAARRTRRAGLVPAVVYGHGTDPVHISLPGHEIQMALRIANALLAIKVDGGKEILALPKQIQRHPIKGSVDHVDLVIVKRGEKVIVEVPFVIVGDDKDDRLVVTDMNAIELECEVTNIPDTIEIDVAGMEIGDQLLAADLKLPEGAVYPGEGDDLVLSMNAAVEADLGDSDEDAEGEEGEGAEEGAAEESGDDE